MKTIKINPTDIRIVPTKKKFENAQKVAQNTFGENGQVIGESGLPKEMPVERPIYIKTAKNLFEEIKNKIQIKIDDMRG